jgi:hypothetical protein
LAARQVNDTSLVICYRLLVESFYDNEWHEVLVYGPYFKARQAKATISGAENNYSDRYKKGTRRSRVQVQTLNARDQVIEWRDLEFDDA